MSIRTNTLREGADAVSSRAPMVPPLDVHVLDGFLPGDGRVAVRVTAHGTGILLGAGAPRWVQGTLSMTLLVPTRRAHVIRFMGTGGWHRRDVRVVPHVALGVPDVPRMEHPRFHVPRAHVPMPARAPLPPAAFHVPHMAGPLPPHTPVIAPEEP